MHFQWVNPLYFYGPCSIANRNKLPEGMDDLGATPNSVESSMRFQRKGSTTAGRQQGFDAWQPE